MMTETESILRRLTRARDLIGLRDALKEHAEAAAGTQVLAEAQAVHDELLASKLNDRHEAWLEAQEWPLADNSFYSRAGHPLASRLRKPWPNPTSRVVHGGRHAGEWPPSQKTADMRQEEWLNDAWPSQGWRHPTTGWIFDPSEFPNGRPPLQPIPDWPLLPRDPASIPPDNPGPTVAESEAALRAAAASRDVMEIRAAMSVHAANVGEESASLSRAKAVVEELLPITANMRHEAKLDAQEWPGPTNNYFSRAGHPLETSLRHGSWPKTADWPPHEALRPPAPASKDPFLAKHRPPSVAYTDFRPLSHVSLADFGLGRGGQRGTQAAASGKSSTSPQAEGRRIGTPTSTAPPLEPDWWPTETRHQVAGAYLTGKSVLAVEFYPPPKVGKPREAADARRWALLSKVAESQSKEAGAHAAYMHALRQAAAHGRPDGGGAPLGYRPGSAAARRAAGGRPPVWESTSLM